MKQNLEQLNQDLRIAEQHISWYKQNPLFTGLKQTVAINAHINHAEKIRKKIKDLIK